MKITQKILVALLIIDVLGIGVLWYGYSVMHNMGEEIKELRVALNTEIERVDRRALIKKLLTLAEKEHLRIEPYLYGLEEESQIRFISEIERLGLFTSGASAEIRSFEARTSGSKSFHGEFSISGTWPQLYRFLRLIEEFPARIVINRFDVKVDPASKAGEWEGAVSLDLVSLKIAP